MERTRLVATGAVILGVFLLTGTVSGGDLADREWNQIRGNPCRTGVVDVEPVRAKPRIAWEQKLSGACPSEPVIWGGMVFVPQVERGRRRVIAYRLATGERLGAKSLGSGEALELGIWQGRLIASGRDGLQGVPFRGTSFGSGWKKKGSVTGPPCIVEGRLIVCADGELRIHDARSGKQLAALNGGIGMVATNRSRGDTLRLVCFDRIAERSSARPHPHLRRFRIESLTGPHPETYRMLPERFLGLDANDASSGSGAEWVEIARIEGSTPGWFISFPGAVRGRSENWPAAAQLDREEPCGLTRLRRSPVVTGGFAYGFARDGSLVKVNSEARFWTLTTRAQHPKGGSRVPGSAARDVLYFGNWAMDRESHHVLWILPELDPAVSAIPAADRLLVVVTRDGRLVALTDEAPEAAAAGAQPTAEAGPLPEKLEGVLLTDGRHVPGAFEPLPNDEIRIIPAKGKPYTVPAERVALAEREEAERIVGEEYAVGLAYQRRLDAGYRIGLVSLYERCAGAREIDACRRLLAIARDRGLPDRRFETLNQKISGKRTRCAENVKAGLAEREANLHRRAFETRWAAAEWCRTRALAGAASWLLADADRILPRQPETEKLAKRLLPPGFPWRDAVNAGREWLRWARAVVPAGAEFLSRFDPAWERIRTGPGAPERIGLRTRHVVLFSRAMDPDVVGACLRNGEGAIRAVERALGGRRIPAGDDERLEMRLSRDRREYLASGAPKWSEGYYSPAEKISRFYVSRDTETNQPLGRDIYRVQAHELTHHWIDQVWMGGASTKSMAKPGFWVVEGMARFVEDQAIEMGRRELRLDDATVRSLQAAAQLEAQEVLFPMARFVEMTGREFQALGTGLFYSVRPRGTLQEFRLSALNIAYEQAGALVFFLYQRDGVSGRKRLREYVRDYYLGKSGPKGWEKLGFENAEEFESEFRTFLAGLRE